MSSPAPGSILMYLPFVSKSMMVPIRPLAQALVDRGHEVTIISDFPFKNIKGITEIDVKADLTGFWEENSKLLLQGDNDWTDLPDMYGKSFGVQDNAVDIVKDLVKEGSKFDVLLTYPFFGNEIGFYLAHWLKAELITYISDMYTGLNFADYAFGAPVDESTKDLDAKVKDMHKRSFREPDIFAGYERVLSKHFPEDEKRPSIEELEAGATAMLSMGHPLLLTGLRPAPPNFVYIGMLQCVEPKPLPRDLDDILNGNPEHGVLYVTFGTCLHANMMADKTRVALMNALGKLKQTVILKWETDHIEGKPANVHLRKWLPQADLLAHPNLKAFVYSAGYYSLEESIFYRKPGVLTPVDYDQFLNADEAERLGIGVNLPWKKVTEATLSAALDKVLNDPSYTSNVEKLGESLAKNQLEKPLDRAIWWIEQAMAKNGFYNFRQSYRKSYV